MIDSFVGPTGPFGRLRPVAGASLIAGAEAVPT